MINSNVASFQNGVNSIYNKCVSLGVTPASANPSPIVSAIQSIAENHWNGGYNSGYNTAYNSTKVYGGVRLSSQRITVSTGFTPTAFIAVAYNGSTVGLWVRTKNWAFAAFVWNGSGYIYSPHNDIVSGGFWINWFSDVMSGMWVEYLALS